MIQQRPGMGLTSSLRAHHPQATLSVRERMLSGAESVRKSARKLTMKRLLTERSMKVSLTREAGKPTDR